MGFGSNENNGNYFQPIRNQSPLLSAADLVASKVKSILCNFTSFYIICVQLWNISLLIQTGLREILLKNEDNDVHKEYWIVICFTNIILHSRDKDDVLSDDLEGEDEEYSEAQLMVTNLDYNISAREWKKILFTEFQQQVKVCILNSCLHCYDNKNWTLNQDQFISLLLCNVEQN